MNIIIFSELDISYSNLRANGEEPRSGRKPGARALIPPRSFTPGETKALAKSKVHQDRGRGSLCVGGHPH